MTSNAKYALSYFLGIAFGGFLFVSLCLSRSAIPCISVIFFSGWFIHLISPTLRCVYACSVKKKQKLAMELIATPSPQSPIWHLLLFQ